MSGVSRNLRPFFIGGIAVLLCWCAPSMLKRFAREAFYEFEAPVFIFSSHIRDMSRYWELRSRSKEELIEAGRDVARIAATQQFELAQLERLKEENKRLESLIALPPRAEYRSLSARVVQRNIGQWWQQMIVRRGRLDGVRVGCPVVSSLGVVGRVREVFAFSSIVELVSSSTFRISVYLEGSNYPVIFHGIGASPFKKPLGMVTDVPSDFLIDLKKNIAVTTSGVGGIFPAGLRIGIVNKGFELTEDGLFYQGQVDLNPSLSVLEEVAILIPLKPEPIEYKTYLKSIGVEK